MEQRKKIVIPLGEGSGKQAGGAKDFDGEATVRAPLFDEEATMGARPVVPIAAVYPTPSARFPLLVIVVILAVSAGVAGGFFIGLYKSGQNRENAAAAPAVTTTASTEQASQTPAQEQLPVAIASEKSPATEPRTVVTAENAATERAAREEKPKRGEDKVSAPVEAREPEREKREREDRERDEQILARQEERELRRQQRQERRRRAREREEADSGDINQQIDRGARELNRIREIFEGQRP